MSLSILRHPARNSEGLQSHQGLWVIHSGDEQIGHFYDTAKSQHCYFVRPFEPEIIEAVQALVIKQLGRSLEPVMAPGLVKVTGSFVPIIDDENEEWGDEDSWQE
jgi:hypothetical protein